MNNHAGWGDDGLCTWCGASEPSGPCHPPRPSWDRYFMTLATVAASRATCPRRQVGAVLVSDKQVLSTGYNGSMPGEPHCLDAGCTMKDGHCIATVHAEANAVAQAAKRGIPLNQATAYVTLQPCWTCTKLLRSAGVGLIFYAEPYGDPPIAGVCHLRP